MGPAELLVSLGEGKYQAGTGGATAEVGVLQCKVLQADDITKCKEVSCRS